MSSLSIIVSLFVILNAVGNIPLFIALLKNFQPAKQRMIIIREMSIALLIMLIFSFLGEDVLTVFNVNIPIFRVAGGILLSLIALDMLFPKPLSTEAIAEEPFIVPLATPIIAGPGTISSVIVFSQELSTSTMLFCIFAAWIPSISVLLLASFLKKIFGEKVLFAFERFAGMLLMFIAVQMCTTGIGEFVHAFHL